MADPTISISSEDKLLSDLLALEAENYRLLLALKDSSLGNVAERISQLKIENQRLKQLAEPVIDPTQATPRTTTTHDLGESVNSTPMTTISSNTESGSVGDKSDDGKAKHLATPSGVSPKSRITTPSSTSSTRSERRSHRVSSLPHNYQSKAIFPEVGRPTSTLHLHKVTTMTPLARTNNYNAGSNEVFQPFMFKQKRRAGTMHSGAILSGGKDSGKDSHGGVPGLQAHSPLSLPDTNGSTSESSLGGERWLKGLALDVRDEDSIQYIRKLSNSLSTEQIEQLRSASLERANSAPSVARSLGHDAYRTELGRMLGLDGSAGGRAIHRNSISGSVGMQGISHSVESSISTDDTNSSRMTHPLSGVQTERDPNTLATTTSSNSLENETVIASSKSTVGLAPNPIVNSALLRELTDSLPEQLTPVQETEVFIDSPPLQQETFEFCSVEADLNYLLALSLNAKLPNYNMLRSPEDDVIHHNANILRSVSGSLQPEPVYFPSRLPSIVTSSYPEHTVSSVDCVNSFCFPDGVTSEVHTPFAADLLTGPHHDQFHTLQFSNQYGETSYACCLIVTLASPLVPGEGITNALIEMSLQKLAAQRIKRNMKLYINAVKKKKWQALSSAAAGAKKGTSGHPSSSTTSVTGRTTSVSDIGTTRHALLSDPKSPESSTLGNGAARTSKTRKASLGGEEQNNESHSVVPPVPPPPERSFISKYFGSSSSSTTVPAAVVNHGQNNGVHLFGSPAKSSEHGNDLTVASPFSPSIENSRDLEKTKHNVELDSDTRERLESVALALKEAKDAGLTSDSSPAMQMSINLLATHGYEFCDDASKKYLSLVPQITELSSHVRPKNHSITSLEAAALTGAEGEKKKSYKFSSFFGFSGRKSKERSSSIPDVADDHLAPSAVHRSSSASFLVSEPLSSSAPTKAALTGLKTNTIESNEDQQSTTETERTDDQAVYSPRQKRKLRDRFRGPSQYLVFQKAYCIITTSPNLSLMYKILQAVADAERHFDSVTPVTLQKQYQQVPIKMSSVGLFRPIDTRSQSDSGKWRQDMRLAFLGKVQRAILTFNRQLAEEQLNNSNSKQISAGSKGAKFPTKAYAGELSSNPPTIKHSQFPVLSIPGYIDHFEWCEEASTSTQEWSMAVLLSCITQRNIFQLINLLLMEKSLVIVGKNVGMVTALAFAVINLLSPFTWEGVFVPMVPDTARELFGAPVPFILGTTTPPRGEDLSPTAAVLFLQESVSFVADSKPDISAPLRPIFSMADAVHAAVKASGKSSIKREEKNCKKHMVIEYTTWFTRLPDVSADMPFSEQLEREVTTAAAFFSSLAKNMWARHYSAEVRALSSVAFQDGLASRSSSIDSQDVSSSIPVFGLTPSTSMSSGINNGPLSVIPNMNLNICFIASMTQKEKRVVQSCLKALLLNNKRFAGDLSDHCAWRRYIKFNPITNEDEFIPHLFMEPMRSVIEFQDAVVQTQLFLGYVDRIRTEYNCVEPYRLFISDWVGYRWRLKCQERAQQQELESRRYSVDESEWHA